MRDIILISLNILAVVVNWAYDKWKLAHGKIEAKVVKLKERSK